MFSHMCAAVQRAVAAPLALPWKALPNSNPDPDPKHLLFSHEEACSRTLKRLASSSVRVTVRCRGRGRSRGRGRGRATAGLRGDARCRCRHIGVWAGLGVGVGVEVRA